MKFRIEFSVPFVRGKDRPRFNSRSKRAYTSDATAAAEDEIWLAYCAACKKAGHPGPVRAPAHATVALCVAVYGELPKRHGKSVMCKPYTVKPDGDNILKLVADALNPKRGVRSGAWADDAQVVRACVEKVGLFRNGEPRTEIAIAWEVLDE